MPDTNFPEYAQNISRVLDRVVVTGEVVLTSLQVNHQLVFRYDNAAHRPDLPAPEHKHTPSGIEVAPVPTLAMIIDLILRQAG